MPAQTALVDEVLEAEVIPYNPDEDVIPHIDGFTPITAYSIELPNLSIIYTTPNLLAQAEAADPNHHFRPIRHTIDFHWGVHLCTSPEEVQVLATKPGIYFENIPAGVPAPVCRKCRFSCRNEAAMIRHMDKMHMD
jgi:hypothetical protein